MTAGLPRPPFRLLEPVSFRVSGKCLRLHRRAIALEVPKRSSHCGLHNLRYFASREGHAMDDRHLGLFLAGEAIDWDWPQRVAIIRRTRSYGQAIDRGVERPELVEPIEPRIAHSFLKPARLQMSRSPGGLAGVSLPERETGPTLSTRWPRGTSTQSTAPAGPPFIRLKPAGDGRPR